MRMSVMDSRAHSRTHTKPANSSLLSISAGFSHVTFKTSLRRCMHTWMPDTDKDTDADSVKGCLVYNLSCLRLCTLLFCMCYNETHCSTTHTHLALFTGLLRDKGLGTRSIMSSVLAQTKLLELSLTYRIAMSVSVSASVRIHISILI